DNGFQEPSFDEAEEVTDEDEDEEWEEEENTDEYDENDGEGRDLDAEEDTDWEERIASGEMQEVHFHMPNGDVVDVPIIQEDNSNQDEDGSSYQVRASSSTQDEVSDGLGEECEPHLGSAPHAPEAEAYGAVAGEDGAVKVINVHLDSPLEKRIMFRL
ncbi:MAG: hypothetical protein IIU49_05100, partial [Spirochaetales bacterium]|nr:hypothetical protein [Spirochaetales bacterium]